ncbi:DUF2971 domain-containing protein [Catellatospora sp. NPDC049111]|uniref:DUF2971 domain-containing protein n=1 Tax=Catellatospora sp. NPDC049111 TaxID=3155271 RepID=UPI0033FDCBB2
MQEHEAYLEAELLSAHPTSTGQLFHYTTADSAISGILRSGTLRLSPFAATNDLWESRPIYPSVTTHHDDRDWEFGPELWEDIDRIIRVHAKVACLTRDWTLPSEVLNPEVLRGWNHLSLWAHYGARHAGVCLRFDRDKLLAAFGRVQGALLRFDGPVQYRRATAGGGFASLDSGLIREFGLDAVAIEFARKHKDLIFFRKHADWSNESEYRLVIVDQSTLPVDVDIRDSLTAVMLGESFPAGRMPEVRESLTQFPGVELFRLAYHNRLLSCDPVGVTDDAATGRQQQQVRVPNRAGDLGERLEALRTSEDLAERQRERAAARCEPHLRALRDRMTALHDVARSWPNVEAQVHPHSTAVPENLRGRRPGVPGEQVHFERGYMCVVENLPKYTCTLVAAGAVQMLDAGRTRFHAVVSIEEPTSDGVKSVEIWRGVEEAAEADAAGALDTIMANLSNALPEARSEFDSRRRPA